MIRVLLLLLLLAGCCTSNAVTGPGLFAGTWVCGDHGCVGCCVICKSDKEYDKQGREVCGCPMEEGHDDSFDER